MMRRIPIVFALALTLPLFGAGCEDRTSFSGGEVLTDSLLAYRTVNHVLTSESYQQWRQAQRALDSADVDARIRIDTRRLTDKDIDRVVKELEGASNARTAIESSGMAVRDYVLTTIALAQSWDAVNRPSARSSGVPRENIEFLRRQAALDSGIRTRPRAQILRDTDDDSDDSDADDDDTDDDDSDDDDTDEADRRRGRGSAKRDSDSDS